MESGASGTKAEDANTLKPVDQQRREAAQYENREEEKAEDYGEVEIPTHMEIPSKRGGRSFLAAATNALPEEDTEVQAGASAGRTAWVSNQDDLSRMFLIEGEDLERPKCAICLKVIESDNFSCASPCMHSFCFDCLRAWAKVRAQCPLCRQHLSSILYYDDTAIKPLLYRNRPRLTKRGGRTVPIYDEAPSHNRDTLLPASSDSRPYVHVPFDYFIPTTKYWRPWCRYYYSGLQVVIENDESAV